MWTTEALHVSEQADLLTGPAQPSNYSARPDGFSKLHSPARPEHGSSA